MRIVDFNAFPDRQGLREELWQAFDDVDFDDAVRTDPIGDATPLGVGFPDELDDDELRERAEALREELDSAVSADLNVRFDLVDGEAETSAGSPDHVE